MRLAFKVFAGTLTLIVLATQAAAATSASQATGSELTHKQVLQIAITEASRSRDPNPKSIEMASGTQGAAMKVIEPGGTGSALSSQLPVDLVVMHGYFHVVGSPPRGRSIAPGKVLELMIDAHTGFVLELSLGNKVLVPLSHLGPVTRLR
jgi:hypothetical protein